MKNQSIIQANETTATIFSEMETKSNTILTIVKKHYKWLWQFFNTYSKPYIKLGEEKRVRSVEPTIKMHWAKSNQINQTTTTTKERKYRAKNGEYFYLKVVQWTIKIKTQGNIVLVHTLAFSLRKRVDSQRTGLVLFRVAWKNTSIR